MADGGDAAVHHVAGRDDVGSGLGQADSGAGEQFERGIVVDFESIAALDDDAAVTVAGVLAEADVSDKDKFFGGRGLAKSAQALLDDAAVTPGAGALLVLGFRQAEQQQAADAEARGFFSFFDRFVDGEVEDAGHGTDCLANAFAGTDKERVDEVAGLENGFAHQGAHLIIPTEPAHAHLRETHE